MGLIHASNFETISGILETCLNWALPL